jgi:hypothetical protein
MTAVQKVEPANNQVAEYAGGILAIIERAARDPSVDIDKLERLISMQERVQARDAELEFNRAMNAAQAEMRPISANASNPQTRSRYATFDKLDRALRPIYTHHGFSHSFDEGESPKPDHVRVLCYLAHISGHTRTYHRDMPADGKGAKGGDVMTKTHAAGAAGSYGARYLLKGIWNVAIGDEDDDGNGGAVNHPVSVDQYDALKKRISDVQADEPKFCEFMRVDDVRDIRAVDFDRAMKALNAKAAKA